MKIESNNKKCNTCGEIKYLSEFSKKASAKGGYQPSCKKCSSIKNKAYREETKGIRKTTPVLKNSEGKVCSVCGKFTKWEKFNKKASSSDKHTSFCRDCQSKNAKKYREENKEKISISLKRWHRENKEEVQIKSKIFRDNNREKLTKIFQDYYQKNKKEIKEKVRKYQKSHRHEIRAYHKNRELIDPLFKSTKTIRKNIASSLKYKGYTKKSKTAKILSCSFEDFKTYIESQFTEGMSFENFGEWHYDHKVPLKLAKTEEEVIKLCHFSNFQPLWAKDNLEKRAKMLPEFIPLRKELIGR